MSRRSPAFSRLSGFGPLPRLFEEENGAPALRRLFADSEVPFDNSRPRMAVSFAGMNDVFNRAVRASGDALFSLRVALAMTPEDYGPFVAFALDAMTLRAAIRRVNCLAPLQSNAMQLRLTDQGNQAQWRIDYPYARGHSVEHHALHVLLPMVNIIRRYVDRPEGPMALHLASPRRAGHNRLEEAMELPIVAGADRYEIAFPSRWLPRPRPQSEARVLYSDVLAYYNGHRLPSTITETIATLLRPSVGETDFDLDMVSQRLAMSRRKVQQLLNAEGSSYRDILLQARIDRAKELIAEGFDSLSQIALSVGYSDQAHFTRAFKTATGLTPREFRKVTIRAEPLQPLDRDAAGAGLLGYDGRALGRFA